MYYISGLIKGKVKMKIKSVTQRIPMREVFLETKLIVSNVATPRIISGSFDFENTFVVVN